MIDSGNDYRRVARGVRTRNPLSAAAIISGTPPTQIRQDDRMSNDLLSNYDTSRIHAARIGKARPHPRVSHSHSRADTEISRDETRFVTAAIPGSTMLKVLRSLREGIENSVDSAVAFSMATLYF